MHRRGAHPDRLVQNTFKKLFRYQKVVEGLATPSRNFPPLSRNSSTRYLQADMKPWHRSRRLYTLSY